ncbi:MAG TPA: ATP-dependent DNA helicase RecG [Verrucomicrobiales bacterium]|nr:ATP-dependent DNA helicase RecG [Verrucomicrobiales bacterium]
MSLRLDTLRGVGPERAAQLSRLGLVTLEDLFLHRPRRHEDRTARLNIRDLKLEMVGTIRGRVVTMGVSRFRRGGRSLFELVVEDGTGRLHCRWWNLPYMQNYFRVGADVFIHGKPISMKPRTMDHPETEVIDEDAESCLHLNRIVPVYPLTEGLPQRWLRAFAWHQVGEFASRVPDPWPPGMLPGRPSRAEAVRGIHFPATVAERDAARERLALDEFIALQMTLQTRRRTLEAKSTGIPCAGDNRLIKPFLRRLGFTLTPSQTEVLRTVRQDLGGRHPMRRLLQGDVGCGKTVVAACSALMALESGWSVALMAPTEILAAQHHRNFQRWFDGFGIRVDLRTGSRKEEGKRAEAGGPVLFVGTHALIEESCGMSNLGLVIIDEQHKFGVGQREKLLRKGAYPHLLVMTATPIPRTLGLTLYGDLDLSIIRHSPGGRGEVRTFVRGEDRLPRVWEFLRQKLREGRQAYVVYPRVEDSGGVGLKAVKQEYARLRELLAPSAVGLLHGRLGAEEKQSVIEAFREGRVQVLVATSVIEVGIDVPNASVMVIESAEQFGLAQLHQLRGRIGRGAHESFCVLVGDLRSSEAAERLGILERTRDGFEIAEADLRLRGPGELVGREQSGMPGFRFADLRWDLPLVEEAREAARRILDQTP